jgi:penicillin-binding protein 1C
VGRPDGTPNPGHFGANTSAPLVKDLLAALGNTTTRPRSVPPGVRALDICWPLGLAATSTAPDHCRVRRAAWTLDGTAPPTLPDRINSASLLGTAWVDAGTSLRLRPGCPNAANAHWVAQPYARWPTLLEPWITSEWRSDADRIAWSPPCAKQDLRRSLRITGIDNGSIVRATPEQRTAVVRVQALGTPDNVSWLLDGRLVGSTDPRSTGLRLTLDQAGDHALTALDAAGRYERVVFSVR